MVYCTVCVMGPHKIFGPRAPQSLNPALIISRLAISLSLRILMAIVISHHTRQRHPVLPWINVVATCLLMVLILEAAVHLDI